MKKIYQAEEGRIEKIEVRQSPALERVIQWVKGILLISTLVTMILSFFSPSIPGWAGICIFLGGFIFYISSSEKSYEYKGGPVPLDQLEKNIDLSKPREIIVFKSEKDKKKVSLVNQEGKTK